MKSHRLYGALVLFIFVDEEPRYGHGPLREHLCSSKGVAAHALENRLAGRVKALCRHEKDVVVETLTPRDDAETQRSMFVQEQCVACGREVEMNICAYFSPVQ